MSQPNHGGPTRFPFSAIQADEQAERANFTGASGQEGGVAVTNSYRTLALSARQDEISAPANASAEDRGPRHLTVGR